MAANIHTQAEGKFFNESNVFLTQDEVDTYHREGLVIPDYRLPEERLARMRAALDRLLNQNEGMASDSMFCPHLPRAGVQGLSGSEEWLEFASDPDILNMVEQLIGPDFLLWGTTIFGKPAGTGKEVPWHQDGEYLPIRPLETLTVWIALDDATPENGCMRYIPGSHKVRRLRIHNPSDRDDLVLNQVLDQSEYNESDAKYDALKAGQISLHDIYLVHGSRPNRSDKRRAGFVLRFMPTASHWDRELGARLAKMIGGLDYENRALFLMRGRDVSGLNDLTIGH